MICERTMCLFSTIQAQRNSYFNRSAIHRTRSIYDSHTIERLTLKIVCQIIPILIYHKAIRIVQRNRSTIRTKTHQINSLMDTFIRIQSLSINLGRSILSKCFISLCSCLSTLKVMTSKSILINHASTRRNLIEFNLIPLTSRHQTLKDVNTLTQDRESLTILPRSHIQITTSLSCQTTRLRRTRILRLQPLCQQ